MYIANNGYVGVGASDPQQKLDVNGYLRIRSTNGEGGTIQLDGNNGTKMWLENLNGKFRLVNNPWTTEIFSVDQSGTTYAYGYYHYSDANLKENIKTSPGMSVIKELHGVTYDWKKDKAKSAGVIAQEVEKVLPNAVHTDERGIKSVDYDQIIAPLIEAMKEQDVRIRKLEEEVAGCRN